MNVLSILIAIAVFATLGALALGLISMARGGNFNARNSNRLMRLRVGLQFVAIVLLAIGFLAAKK